MRGVMRVCWSVFVALLMLDSCAPDIDVSFGPTTSDPQAGDDGTFDVVVVGAGAGGIAAAIQVARMHRSVVLIEPTSHIGGQLLTVTSMDESVAVPAPELPPERRDGIYAEFAQRIVDRYQRLYNGKPVGTCYHPNNNSLCYEAFDGEQVLIEWLHDEGVRLEVGRDVLEVRMDQPHQVTGVVTADGVVWPARIVIDATEYGDVLPLAGAAYRIGNQVRDVLQPPSDSLRDTCVQQSTYTVTIRSYPSLPQELDLGDAPPGPNYDLHAQIYRTILLEEPQPTG